MKRLHLLIGSRPGDMKTLSSSLSRLIARGERHDTDAGLHAALARLFGVALADLPAIERADPDNRPGPWYRAEPAHLLAGMHSLTLFDLHECPPIATEANDLLDALNRHFEGEIEFHATDPIRWFACGRLPAAAAARPLDELAGRPLEQVSLRDVQTREWQRLLMEIQMLLHVHPANEAREARGAVPINSLWLWGGGEARPVTPRHTDIHADDPATCALAQAAGLTATPLPTGYDALEAGPESLVVLTGRPLDDALDSNWFQPVLAALQAGRLDELHLSLPGREGYRIRVTPWRARAFWRISG